MSEEMTITEWSTPNLGQTVKITKMLHEETTPYQHIQIAESLQYGRMLVLDGVFQTSEKDEWTYHEMISHVPLMLHPHPERVLIIGGGDGGVAREVCRHECVTQVDLCDIDGRVIDLSKEYFPEIAKVLLDPPAKLHVHVGDGIAFAKSVKNFYDVIIIDCSDPIGPGEGQTYFPSCGLTIPMCRSIRHACTASCSRRKCTTRSPRRSAVRRRSP